MLVGKDEKSASPATHGISLRAQFKSPHFSAAVWEKRSTQVERMVETLMVLDFVFCEE